MEATGRFVLTLTIVFGFSVNCALSAWPTQQAASPPLIKRLARSTVSFAGPGDPAPVLIRTWVMVPAWLPWIAGSGNGTTWVSAALPVGVAVEKKVQELANGQYPG